MVAALITPGSEILLKNVGINPTRDGVVSILNWLAEDKDAITLENERNVGTDLEPVADIRVKYSRLIGKA